MPDLHTPAIAVHGLAKRERDGRRRSLAAESANLRSRRWQVEAAVLKLHSRRVTCLEFHPHHDHLVLSGDKKGQIAIWCAHIFPPAAAA